MHQDGRALERVLSVYERPDDLPEPGRTHVETVPNDLFTDPLEGIRCSGAVEDCAVTVAEVHAVEYGGAV